MRGENDWLYCVPAVIVCKCKVNIAYVFQSSVLSFCSPVQGQYDRVHCGAACPTSKLGPLLDLLRPEGGLIVTPVEPSDLRVIIKKPDGAVTSRIISQVRYSTLEVGQPAGTPLIDRHHWFHVFDHLAHITPSPKVPLEADQPDQERLF